ncbi:hypothetical protein PIROE2DRAFT_15258, partial [Piromyces sp. E2]
GNQNISSPFKLKPSLGVGGIAKIKEEDETGESGNSDDEKLTKNDVGELSEKSLLKYTVKNEAAKSKLNQCSDIDDKMANPFSCNIKEILWYIDNNEFPSITADSMTDMPSVSELIKRNSITPEEIEMIQSRQRRSFSEYTSESSFHSVDIPNSMSFNNIKYNNMNPLNTGMNENNNTPEIENETIGNETISIIDTNNISNSTSNENNNVSEDLISENDMYNSYESNTSNESNKFSSVKIFEEPMEFESMKGKERDESQIEFDVHPGPMKNLTYQLSKSKSLPMLHNIEDEEEEEESVNEEKKEKLAIERRNSYLREKFYLKNNIVNRPQEENFTKMIAMYDYQHQSDDELDLTSNEEVTLVIPDDGSGWAMVSSNKGCGLVPANYLMECAQVTEDFTPSEDEEDKITVKSGDVLLILEKDDGSGYTKVNIFSPSLIINNNG